MGLATDWNGNSIACTKPILVLTDEFMLSAAEVFAMVLQDAQRATIFGMRTDGGGGNPGVFDATTYSEGAPAQPGHDLRRGVLGRQRRDDTVEECARGKTSET